MTSSNSTVCAAPQLSSTATVTSAIGCTVLELRTKIDELLGKLPESRIDAKRLLERELGVQLEPNELNTLTGPLIDTDPASMVRHLDLSDFNAPVTIEPPI